MMIVYHLNVVADEWKKAKLKFPDFNSAHEGYAVLLEELDELWDEIKANKRTPAYKECVQVAAMALRFLTDLYPEGRPNDVESSESSGTTAEAAEREVPKS